MKRIFLLCAMLAVVVMAHAQQPVKVETFRLDNGLKVVLCEEHSQPKIYGCVVVHAGSKNENPAATGVAHYFEHIMFKGTDRIGTTDWSQERLYLDSISQAYDRLHATQDAAKRHDIQLEINRLNIAASKYAIPNEVDAILQKMGCTGLNAGTSYDYTVYYNMLPSNQLSNWMDVYVERFRNPVFRLFQSELEAVYEEKNMYENQMGYDFSRNIFTEAFGDHPYSRDVIGLADHLKNPQPSEMQKFFDTYYVANNMTLLLVGDFNTAEARQLVEAKFSTWRSGVLPERPTYNLPKFDSRKVREVKQTPVKMGLMVFPGVTEHNPDYMPLEMLSSILGGGSGLLDKATSDNRIMEAQLMPLSLEEAGSNVVLYMPNIIGQSHEEAEQVVWDCIDSIKQGHFSDELLESIKTSTIAGRQRQVENLGNLSNLLLSLELSGFTYDQWLRNNERWMNITREDVMAVANKYFDPDHCTIVRSKMGFPKHDSAVKPDWDHLEAQNQDVHSAFAMMIEANKPVPIKPQIIDFKKDVDMQDVTNHCRLFSTTNPKNDVFELRVVYNYGDLDDYNLSRAIEYLNMLGADGKDLQQFNMEMDKLGGSCYLYNYTDQAVLYISGLEQNMDSILSLAVSRLNNPTHDSKQIVKIVDGLKASKKAAKNSSDSWSDALDAYVDFGEKSEYLRQMPYKEWSGLTGEQLHAEVMKIFGRNGYATFTGNTDPSDVCAKLRQYGLVREEVQDVPFDRAFTRQQYDKPQLFYAHNKKFLQSDIGFTIPSCNFDTADLAVIRLFNEYFGGGMNSIVFQEIREFRSLGYSTHGSFGYSWKNLNPAFMYCYLGTQCDKTQDGVEAMRDLLVTLPERPDKFLPAIEYLVSARNSGYVSFRQVPSFVYSSLQEGYNHDQRAEITERISHLTMDDLKAFHAKYIAGRPIVVTVSGNAKKFNPKAVAKLLGPDTKITEVTYKQMFRF